MSRLRRSPLVGLTGIVIALATACRAPVDHLEAKNAVGPYSAGVVVDGPLLFLSGKIGPPGGSFADEMNGALDAVAADLARGGATFADVVLVNVYLTDMTLFDEMNRLYAARIQKPWPARTTVAVVALPKGAHVELQATARVR